MSSATMRPLIYNWEFILISYKYSQNTDSLENGKDRLCYYEVVRITECYSHLYLLIGSWNRDKIIVGLKKQRI